MTDATSFGPCDLCGRPDHRIFTRIGDRDDMKFVCEPCKRDFQLVFCHGSPRDQWDAMFRLFLKLWDHADRGDRR